MVNNFLDQSVDQENCSPHWSVVAHIGFSSLNLVERKTLSLKL